MVSYFHFLRALHGQDVDFLALVQGEGIPCLWQDHVTSWLANPYQANLLIIKYEDLLTQPIPELKKFCNFVEVEREEEIIKKVIEQTSFSKMRQREIKQGWEDENWPKDKLFIRRGKSGSYRDEMPPAVLEKFLEKASPILEKFGYL
ncbi:MAG: hypothetical protein D6711_03815 [Chloroflexi bacterium]|nr:MAG: hypothetical protein D6711_03815 [Chloroflexota bacterium]